MIRSAQIARFRGIRDLVVDGFGRVNLIIGKNDCGKTALMEALRVGDDARDAAPLLYMIQKQRLAGVAKPNNFDRFWRPLFFNLDAKLGFTIAVANGEARRRVLEVRQGPTPDEIISPEEPGDLAGEDEHLLEGGSWSLELQLQADKERSEQRVVATSTRLRIPPPHRELASSWITPAVLVGTVEVRAISELKQAGREGELLELLREINGRLAGIELLAPGGSTAELFVRLDAETPLLPIRVMGDGFQHCLEIENGMHHLVLEPLWRWIGVISRKRNLQVFATTHSEECIHAACRAFGGLDDDGLRVIRLDRLEGGTRAVIYDRTLVEAAARTGTEIRG
jgi:hypothetical protein